MAITFDKARSQPGRRLFFQHRGWAAALGVFLALHGLVHAIGFAEAWRVGTLAYRTTVLGGHLDLGAVGIRGLGLLWLLAGSGFLAVGLRLAWRGSVPGRLLAAVALLSLVICLLGLPESGFGAVINGVILVVPAILVRQATVAGSWR
jgi:hypothetical protein